MTQQYYKKVLKQCLIGQDTHYCLLTRISVLKWTLDPDQNHSVTILKEWITNLLK